MLGFLQRVSLTSCLGRARIGSGVERAFDKTSSVYKSYYAHLACPWS